MTYWVYILENPHGRFYIGHTENLERRLSEHNSDENNASDGTGQSADWNQYKTHQGD
jgi:predicted GIY-YIG superfamily endonuclease